MSDDFSESDKATANRTNARRDVEKLLEEMRTQARVMPVNVAQRFNELTHQIETLVRTYLEPAIADPVPGVHLTTSEGRILARLALQLGKTVHKNSLMDAVYFDKIEEAHEKIIDVMICKMRRKILGSRFEVETVWGKGYRLKDAQHATAA